MRGLPRNAFWDVDTASLDLVRDQHFIIERVLEYGDEKIARWLLKSFPRASIVSVVKNSHRLTPKSRNLWGIKLGLWQHLPQSIKKPKKIWQY